MAKLVVMVDTEEETFTTTVDGKDVPNVCNVNVYCYDDDDTHFEVCACEKTGDLSTMVRLCASEHAKAGKADIVKESAIAGYVEVRRGSVVQNYIGSLLQLG